MNKKEKLFLNLLYIISILIFILNIISVCIKGANLWSNITGWFCAICWIISHWGMKRLYDNSTTIDRNLIKKRTEIILIQSEIIEAYETEIKKLKEKLYNSEDNIDEQ